MKKHKNKIAVLVVLSGLLIMTLGSTNIENRFSFWSVTLAPIIMLTGYALVAITILKNKFE